MKRHFIAEWLWAQLRYRWVIHAASIALLSVAMLVTVCVLLSPAALSTKAQIDVGKVGLVLAGKGSGLQWVMASLYHIDVPPSNVGLDQVNQILAAPAAQAQIAKQVRIALGDSVNGARLVGVDSMQGYLDLFDGHIANGAMPRSPMQAAVGAAAAQRLNLRVGSQFFSSHGLNAGGSSHDDSPYTVTAVLKPTGAVLDTLVLTPIESVWLAHEGTPRDAQEALLLAQSRDITAVLIEYRYPVSALSLPVLLEKQSLDDMTVTPIAPQVQRLWVLFEPFFQLLMGLSLLIGLSAAITILLSNRLTQPQRLRDLAVLRVMGVPPRRLAVLILCEFVVVWLFACGVFNVALGLLFGWLNHAYALPLQPLLSAEWFTISAVVVAGLATMLLGAALCAYRLLQQSVSQVLQSR